MNQLFRLLEKEIGVVYKVQIRRIPRVKDGDAQDDLDIWEAEAKEKGIIFEDDTLENTRVPLANTTTSGAVDLTRTQEIQSRYSLAVMIKNEAQELIGMNRERQGGKIAATQTATATQTQMIQSFAQTEPLFTAHDYVMNQVYQAILDAAQYIESKKPDSTLSFINSEGESAFIQVTGADIKLRDLWVFATSNPEDQKLFEEIRSLSQAMIQNGASAYEIVEMYSTNSIREMKRIFKALKEKVEEYQQAEQQLKQAELQQTQQLEAQKMQNENINKEKDRQTEIYIHTIDNIADKEKALLGALGKNPAATADTDADGVADALEITNLATERQKAISDYNLEIQKLSQAQQQHKEEMDDKKEDRKVERENMDNDLQIEKLRLKAAKAKKPTSKTKKK